MPSDLTMQDQVCIITGANGGIGKATAIGLADKSAHVVMVCRSLERGQAALDEVQAATGSESLDLMICDLAQQDDIRQFAAVFQARYDRLDVLINNAAIIPAEREVSPDGIEMQLAVNHLGPFLLTNLLLDLIKDSTPARIITLSSSVHTSGNIDFDDLQSENSYSMMGWGPYANTKLMNILFTRELSRRLRGVDVTANCLHPGYVATGLQRNIPAIFKPFNQLFGGNPEKGAETVIYLASSPDVAGSTGLYYADKKPAKMAAAAQDDVTAHRLWEVSEQLTGLDEPPDVIA